MGNFAVSLSIRVGIRLFAERSRLFEPIFIAAESAEANRFELIADETFLRTVGYARNAEALLEFTQHTIRTDDCLDVVAHGYFGER
jgi:hypothetical protein